jgi:hypothetical protein
LEIGIGAAAAKQHPLPALYGAMAGTLLIDGPSSRIHSEEEVRIRRFRSICFSVLMCGAMILDPSQQIISGLGGFFAVQALARRVIGSPLPYS